jgi:DNA replication protein DnaC
MNTDLNDNCESSIREFRDRAQAGLAKWQLEHDAFLSTVPPSTPCKRHPEVIRLRDENESSKSNGAVYKPCELCWTAQRLQQMGVPPAYCEATLQNWTPDDDKAALNLDRVREFGEAKRGFLVLLGKVGTGKTHLAVASLRSFKSGLFIKQAELLRRLRKTYAYRSAVDPTGEAQNARCLVLDEIGVSPGGRDELPLLHEILDYRHCHLKPTILTGNLTFEALSEVIGARMADRLKESAFAVLSFGGRSHRSQMRERYFDLNSHGFNSSSSISNGTNISHKWENI